MTSFHVDDLINFYKCHSPSKITSWKDVLLFFQLLEMATIVPSTAGISITTTTSACMGIDTVTRRDQDKADNVNNMQTVCRQQDERKRTLLHHHFKSSRLTGLDDDEMQVARWLLKHSVMMVRPQNNNDGIIVESGLTGPRDDFGKIPLHYLFEDNLDIDYKNYVNLIMQMSDEIDRVRGTPVGLCWIEIMLMGNEWGCTVLHLIAENQSIIDSEIAASVVKKCLAAWEYCHEVMPHHPLLHADNDGEIPLDYIFCRDDYFSEDNKTYCLIVKWIDVFLGFVECDDGTHQIAYKPTYDAAFQVTCSFLEAFCDFHNDLIHEWYQENGWWSTEEREFVNLERFLCSRNSIFDIKFNHRHCGKWENAWDSFWQRMCLLLQAAVRSNLHYMQQHRTITCSQNDSDSRYYGYTYIGLGKTDKYAGLYLPCDIISSEPTHLAASVGKFPAYVLQMTMLMCHYNKSDGPPSVLLHHDEHGRIPLHYALLLAATSTTAASCIVASNYNGEITPSLSRHNCGQPQFHTWQHQNPQHHEQRHPNSQQELLTYWNSDYEPRSMVQYILDHEPDCVHVADADGRLPIHLAVLNKPVGGNCNSISWSMTVTINTVLAVVHAAPHHLATIDPISNLKPFMLAASGYGSILEVIYLLLRLDPSCLLI